MVIPKQPPTLGLLANQAKMQGCRSVFEIFFFGGGGDLVVPQHQMHSQGVSDRSTFRSWKIWFFKLKLEECYLENTLILGSYICRCTESRAGNELNNPVLFTIRLD